MGNRTCRPETGGLATGTIEGGVGLKVGDGDKVAGGGVAGVAVDGGFGSREGWEGVCLCEPVLVCLLTLYPSCLSSRTGNTLSFCG